MPLSSFEAKNLSKAWNNSAPTTAASLWVQLHTGDPGVNCTNNVAAESKRKKITLKELSAGVWTNEKEIEWESVAATEKATHCSAWDAEKEGNPRVYGENVKEVQLTKEQDARFKPETLKLTLK